MPKINLRGINFDNVTIDEAVALADRALKENQQTVIYTPNAEIAQLAGEDQEFHSILCRADILLPDGAGIILASEILKTPLKEKVAGVDFGERILSLAAKNGYSIFFLGGKPSVAELAVQKKTAQYPGLSVVGTQNGYYKKEGIENDAVLQKINDSGAQILFVCLGAPLQEKWIDNNKSRLHSAKLIMGLGGTLDVFAETVRRAPKFFIRARLEWFYRLLQDPKRIGRTMKLPKYVLGTYREKFFSRKS